MVYKLDFYTQYNQFYITSDNGCALDQRIKSDSGYVNRLTLAKNLLIVRTESYGQIKGEVQILDSINDNIDSSKFDHIVEAGIEVESGILQILDCPNAHIELEIKVKPGTYRVRIYSSNMKGYDSDEDKEDDYYKIEIWPDKNMESKILKKYSR